MGEALEPGDGNSEQLRGMLQAVGTPDELRQLLETPGVDDAVIAQFAQAVGVDNLLDRVFGLMGTRFVPERAGKDGGAARWNIDTPDGVRTYHLVIAGGRADGGRGAPDKTKVTLGMSLQNLLRLCAGRLNGVTGVMTGKIKISGDMMFGAKMQGWFDYS
ncbi:SCP2 sterol-binding domain-containing protein [Spirillospora sp. NPDC048911]|uniref:SCP2 sterol-binding domain-containing protein n=1 Tax=Spirillospora sp. NPDC048911 TaxID=3364527 RepID=UPI0037206012